MPVNITIDYPTPTVYPVPSSNVENDWAYQQVLFEQALATAVNYASTNAGPAADDAATAVTAAATAVTNANAAVVTANAAAAAVAQGSYTLLTRLGSGFTGNAEWRQNSNGKVYFRGALTTGAAYTNGQVISTGFAHPPPVNMFFVVTIQGVGPLMIEFLTSGSITVSGTGLAGPIDFGQVSFETVAF